MNKIVGVERLAKLDVVIAGESDTNTDTDTDRHTDTNSDTDSHTNSDSDRLLVESWNGVTFFLRRQLSFSSFLYFYFL